MSLSIEMVYDHGVLRPLAPLLLPEGTRVRVHLEKTNDASLRPSPARIISPRLVHPEQTADFEMQVREVPDAGV